MQTVIQPATTVAELLLLVTKAYGDRPALIKRSGLRSEVWTYNRLQGAAYHVAQQLLENYRLAPGNRVMIQGYNGPEWVAAYLGCMVAGLIIVPLDRFSAPEFIARIAALTDAAAMISKGHDGTQSLIAGARLINIADLGILDGSAEPLQHSLKPDDIAEIIFTSGTTGEPKGVILTHHNLLTSVKSIQNVYPHRPQLRFLSLLPLSHMFEQTVGLFAPLSQGAILYYPDGRHSLSILQKISTKRIQGAVGVPQLLDLLLRSIEKTVTRNGKGTLWRYWPFIGQHLPFSWRRFFTGCLFPQTTSLPEFFVCGGAPLPIKLEQHLENIGIRVVQGYGATECAPVIATNRFDKRITGAVGWPAPGVELKLSDEGEILVRGENVTQGYWKNGNATRAVFTKDHFYRTADLGEIGKEGELYIRGRRNNAIVLSNGLNVFPEDIEPVLAAQPGVDTCVVVALPAPDGSPCITGVVRLQQEEINPAEKENIVNEAVRSANAKLAPHQRIAAVRIWQGAFPRTPLMKIQRWKIRESLQNEQPLKSQNNLEIAEPGALPTLEHLLAAISRVPVGNISDTTDLGFDLGLDSLGRVELTVLIEQQFGTLIDDAELLNIRRVDELKRLIKQSDSVSSVKTKFPAWPLSGRAVSIRRFIHSCIAFPVHRVLSRSWTVTGIENLHNLPLPALFIANHCSHVDTLSILRALPLPIRIKLAGAAAADYFFNNRLLANFLALSVNAFPFTREGSIRSSLEYCGELMDNGWSILIYPEGTRSTTGKLLDFKPGIGFLATGLGVPIVPIAVSGGYEILPKGALWPHRNDVHVSFGAPVHVPQDADQQITTRQLHEIVSRLLDVQKI